MKKCPAKYNFGFVFLDFDGFGIKIENKENLNSEIVRVEYFGEIGNPNFVIKSVGEV